MKQLHMHLHIKNHLEETIKHLYHYRIIPHKRFCCFWLKYKALAMQGEKNVLLEDSIIVLS